MRQRIEDLGRIMVLLDNLLTEDIFHSSDVLSPHRCKDYDLWWEEKCKDDQYEILRKWVYGLDNVKTRLYEILEIAKGEDYLNEVDKC